MNRASLTFLKGGNSEDGTLTKRRINNFLKKIEPTWELPGENSEEDNSMDI